MGEVSLFFRSPHILDKEEEDAQLLVEEQFIKEGICIISNCQYEKVEYDGNSSVFRLYIKRIPGDTEVYEVDQLLVSTGRTPNIEGLDLESASVEYESTGIKVNKYLQTTNSNIYSAGDCCMKYKFTHAADFSARAVIRNALFWGKSNVNDLVIPWCTYTYPEVAHVGLYEADLIKKKIKYQAFKKNLDHNDRAILDGDPGYINVLIGRYR